MGGPGDAAGEEGAVIPALRDAAVDPALRGRDRQLLLVLVFELDPVVPRPVKHIALAERLRMKRTHVSRSLRHLVHCGYLARGADDGPLATYRLCYQRTSPHLVPSHTAAPLP